MELIPVASVPIEAERSIPWKRPDRRPFPVSRPVLSGHAKAYVENVLDSGWWGYGPVAKYLEAQVEQFLNAERRCLATSSCTAALHLALLAEGIGNGDEVILPAFTYASTAAVVRYTGAKPVFADIDPDRLMLDLNSVRSRYNSRTRAIMPVHFAGAPGPFDALRSWAKQQGLIVIEDAAHALGSIDSHGRAVGCAADYTAFSLAATKPIPSPGGGLLAFADPAKAEILQRLSSMGLTADTFTRFHGQNGPAMQTVVDVGYNYRMNDLAAALAVANFEAMPDLRERRAALVARYCERLGSIDGIGLPTVCENERTCWYLMTVRVPKPRRDPIRRRLLDRGIDTSVHYANLAASAALKMDTAPGDLPHTEDAAATIVSLPLFGDMNDDDVDAVCHALDLATADVATGISLESR